MTIQNGIDEIYKEDGFIRMLVGILIGVAIMGFITIVIVLGMPDPKVEVITVEGMTCIEYNNSLTCNWSEWKGEAR